MNKQKCKFGASQLPNLGHVISSEGLKPDSKKVQAILDMPPPHDKSDMQRFLGAISYLGKFIPNLSTLTEPLRKLLNKDAVWEFSSEQIKAFESLKKMVTETPVLQFFYPKLNVRVGADSSKSGLGAILEQEHPKNEWKPVAFASRSLSKAEKNYAPIEKECLSVVFATNRFRE